MAWRAARPRSAIGVFVFALVAGGLAVALWLGPGVVASVTTEYGFRPEANEAVWRGLTPAYGEVGQCATCHEVEYAKLTSATHAGIGCESCHGPLGEHALASPGLTEAEIRLEVAVPTDRVCVTCHAATLGRPSGFREIVRTDHYVSACLDCHDPHTGISQRPPVVEHTLERLPPCITCHGPEGFKARNQRHPLTPDADYICLSCHLPGRGPEASPSTSP